MALLWEKVLIWPNQKLSAAALVLHAKLAFAHLFIVTKRSPCSVHVILSRILWKLEFLAWLSPLLPSLYSVQSGAQAVQRPNCLLKEQQCTHAPDSAVLASVRCDLIAARDLLYRHGADPGKSYDAG